MAIEGAQTTPDVVEDVFEGHATDIEVEDSGGDTERIQRPWNPDQIRVNTSQFSLRNILDQIDEGSIELAPDFQRLQVWRADQKSLLVESLLLQIPLPAFYFAEDVDGSFRVVDGLQRLSTLHAFVRGGEADGFALGKLEHLDDLKDLRFSDLPVPFQRRINNTQLIVNVIDPTTPRGVTYEIFKRINTGGTPLNGQEIRHCMSSRRSRDTLHRMTHTDAFAKATGGRLTNHIRMNDREMALRFAAFWLKGGLGVPRAAGDGDVPDGHHGDAGRSDEGSGREGGRVGGRLRAGDVPRPPCLRRARLPQVAGGGRLSPPDQPCPVRELVHGPGRLRPHDR